eukprot:UN22945
MQRYVNELYASGGGDEPEALCCGLAEVSQLQWNYTKQAMRVVILISDAPPHGFHGDTNYDDNPDGCPCGSDSLRVLHTMKQKGICLYTIDCGRSSQYSQAGCKRQHLFQAMARITGGVGLNLTQSDCLSKIVLGACVDEQNKLLLCEQITPILKKIRLANPIATLEQRLYMVEVEMKRQKIKLKCALPHIKYDHHTEEMIEVLAECMDLKQAKAQGNQNHFDSLQCSKNLNLKMNALKDVPRSVIKNCFAMIEDSLAKEKFLKEGCSFRGNFWKREQYHGRRNELGRAGFPTDCLRSLWKQLTHQDKQEWSNVLKYATPPRDPGFGYGRRVALSGSRRRAPVEAPKPKKLEVRNAFALLDENEEAQPRSTEPTTTT